MLKRTSAELYDDQGPPQDDSQLGPGHSDSSELELFLAAARRQAVLFVVCCIVGVMAGVGYFKTRTPDYAATASVLVDNQQVRAVQDAYQALVQGSDVAASYLDTQMELLVSDPILLKVIDKLGLVNDPEFNRNTASLLSLLLRKAKLPSGEVEDELRTPRQVAEYLKSRVEVRRLPRTPILQITCKSERPEKAAALANGFVEAYLSDQLDAKYESTRRVSAWLQERIAELKERVLASDLALQKFKEEHDLISSSGRLVNEQQLTEVNTQLVNARAETAQAAARHQRAKTIREQHQTDAIVSGAISNQIIERLRQSFVNALKRESELSSKVGPDHASVVALRQEMREYEKLMFQELGRVEEVYLNEWEVARSREKAIEDRLASLVGAAASTNRTLVTLRELERESESYRTLYQSMLQRNQEVLQAQSVPVSESRLIISAWPPDRPSYPKPLPILAVALILGGGIGVSLGVLREFLDAAFRTPQQVRQELQLELLGMLPVMERHFLRGSAKQTNEKNGKLIARAPARMRHVFDHPLSGYAEALSAVKVSADLALPRRGCKKIGVVSVLPGEGKSTVTFNLGVLLAQVGMRTLVVDADIRNPQLTRRIASETKGDIVSAAVGGGSEPVDAMVLRDENLPLALLPAGSKKLLPHTWAILTSPGVGKVLDQSEAQFDFILFDLPPMGAVLDASAFAPQLDAVVVVIEWGATARRLVRVTLENNPRVRERCIGVVLNKVDMGRLTRYVRYDSKEYYHARYSAYFQKD
jgi:succinoglycan biosynthesis transport protein ExoP